MKVKKIHVSSTVAGGLVRHGFFQKILQDSDRRQDTKKLTTSHAPHITDTSISTYIAPFYMIISSIFSPFPMYFYGGITGLCM